MALTRDKVAQIVKRRLKIADEGVIVQIPDYVEQMEYEIKRFCNLSRMPDDILYLWVDLVKELMITDMPNEDFAIDAQGPSNVSIGKFSYSTTKVNADRVMTDNQSKLIQFRRIRTR